MMLPDDIAELDGNWWFSPDGPAATPRRIAAHMRLAMEADLSHPIILCADGRLMARAVAEQRSEIAYVRFAKTPAPDYVNVSLDALPYPEDEP